ncbi:MAG: formimidoylglutamase [Bacteroidia bacterium]|nr:formimidoylglutamase [Bacteroidia bacterium]MDW8157347.1 formimidoylglutamase [Bacteroidia bacterium]
MDIIHFLEPLPYENFILGTHEIIELADIYFEQIPDWQEADVILVGCNEYRGAQIEEVEYHAPNLIRQYLYTLVAPDSAVKIADLGNIKIGITLEDTFFAVQKVITPLLRSSKPVVFLGGSQDLTYALYCAFETMEEEIEYVTIDSSPDIYDSQIAFTNRSCNHQIILHQPHYLSHFTVLGIQSYFVSELEKNALSALHYEMLRLGELHQNIKLAEPYLRQASLISLDLAALKMSEAPGSYRPAPTGFTTEEICQIARYAGMALKSNIFGIFELNPSLDFHNQTAYLCALIIWHYIEGLAKKIQDVPKADRSNLQRYRVPMNGPIKEIVFYKSPLTERWWVEVPNIHHSDKFILVPCSYNDYEMATHDIIPPRYWVAYYKYS